MLISEDIISPVKVLFENAGLIMMNRSEDLNSKVKEDKKVYIQNQRLEENCVKSSEYKKSSEHISSPEKERGELKRMSCR